MPDTAVVVRDAASVDVARQDAPGMLEIVMRAVADPTIDPSRLREFLQIGRELEADRAKKDYIAAFHAAKQEMDGIKIRKDGKIVYDKPGKAGGVIKFMKYDDIADAIKPILARHDLVATYTAEFTVSPPKTVVVMELMHKGGHSKEYRSVPLPMVDSGGGKNDIQGAGSVSAYGRRYVVVPAFDIVAEGEDNDGAGSRVIAITPEQVQTIWDIVEECNNRDPKFSQLFVKWLRAEFAIDNPVNLFQGAQLKAVMAKLDEKMVLLGMKKK